MDFSTPDEETPAETRSLVPAGSLMLESQVLLLPVTTSSHRVRHVHHTLLPSPEWGQQPLIMLLGELSCQQAPPVLMPAADLTHPEPVLSPRFPIPTDQRLPGQRLSSCACSLVETSTKSLVSKQPEVVFT